MRYLITSAMPADLPLPTEVTSAIVGRVERLGEGCRSILTLAALLGDRFGLDVLGAVSGMDEEALLNLLEEGMRQHLLRSEGQTFQFAHPLIRHVFYHEPSAPRRQRIHRQIAAVLERVHADSLEAHVLEIAHHLVRALPAADAQTVMKYAHQAGWVFLIPRILGVAATVNRWWKQAEDHFQCAIDISTNVNAPPELGRTYLDYARMLVARNRKGDRSRAEELVSHASHIFHELGMAPFARDASQLAEKLRVRKPQAPQLRTASLGRLSEREVGDLSRERRPTDDHSLGEGMGQALHIILVTVMEGSTALRQQLGDAKSHEILRIHDALLRGCLLQHNGTEVTHTGDGIEASFLICLQCCRMCCGHPADLCTA